MSNSNPAYKGTAVERFGWAREAFRDAAARCMGKVREFTFPDEAGAELHSIELHASYPCDIAATVAGAWVNIGVKVDASLRVVPMFNVQPPVCVLALSVFAPVAELRAAGFDIPDSQGVPPLTSS